MNKLSIIIPFVNEWPQVAFTIRSVYEQLKSRIDFEIIMIDNYCTEVYEAQKRKPDRGHEHYSYEGDRCPVFNDPPAGSSHQLGHIAAMAEKYKWLKCCNFHGKLSHWNSKNVGVENSNGDVLLFLDAHVVPSDGLLLGMFKDFDRRSSRSDNYFTLHAPLTYHILENKLLIYKMIYEERKGILHYRFMTMPENIAQRNEVPCMSTCGMMMSREYFDLIKGWPTALGIYGGGENYLNFYSSLLGCKKFIYPYGVLHHHGDKRGYNFNWEDYHRNRMIATCMYGSSDMVKRYLESIGVNATTERMMRQAVRGCEIHRIGNKSLDKIITTIEDWVEDWKDIEYR